MVKNNIYCSHLIASNAVLPEHIRNFSSVFRSQGKEQRRESVSLLTETSHLRSREGTECFIYG